MTNILLAVDDFYYAKNLMACINQTTKEARIYNIATDGKEALEILNNGNDIDIVLLQLKMPTYTGPQIIEKLSPNQKPRYRKSFIIISDKNSANISKTPHNNFVYEILPKNLEPEKIVYQLSKLMNEKNSKLNNIEAKIMNEMMYLGYNVSHKGTRYLIEIINMVYIEGEDITDNLTKYVYPRLAKKYNQTVPNIKCNVIRATETMFYNCDEERLKSYFRYKEVYKPNVKTVIHTVLKRVCQKK